MSKPIGVLAIGQGAASIAVYFAGAGCITGALNTSEADLRAVERQIPNRELLEGYGGAGKDRSLGYRAVVDNTDRIVRFIKRHYADAGLRSLLVIYTLGGGTGSGAGPTVAALAAEVLPGVVINPVVVLPDQAEPAIARINAVAAFAELSSLGEAVGGTFVLDNEKALRLYGLPSYYLYANTVFTGTVLEALAIPEQATSPVSNFDYQELFGLMSEPGMIGIYRTEIPMPFDGHGQALLDRAYAKGVLADPTAAKMAGLIVQAPGAEKVVPFIRLAPEPAVLHRGIYEDDRKLLTVILAGMQWPTQRLKAVEDTVDRSLESLAKPIEEYRPEGLNYPFARRRDAGKVQSVLEKLRQGR